MSGKTERSDTFASRTLDETPKFVRQKLKRAEEAATQTGAGTSDALLR